MSDLSTCDRMWYLVLPPSFGPGPTCPYTFDVSTTSSRLFLSTGFTTSSDSGPPMTR